MHFLISPSWMALLFLLMCVPAQVNAAESSTNRGLTLAAAAAIGVTVVFTILIALLLTFYIRARNLARKEESIGFTLTPGEKTYDFFGKDKILYGAATNPPHMPRTTYDVNAMNSMKGVASAPTATHRYGFLATPKMKSILKHHHSSRRSYVGEPV